MSFILFRHVLQAFTPPCFFSWDACTHARTHARTRAHTQRTSEQVMPWESRKAFLSQQTPDESVWDHLPSRWSNNTSIKLACNRLCRGMLLRRNRINDCTGYNRHYECRFQVRPGQHLWSSLSSSPPPPPPSSSSSSSSLSCRSVPWLGECLTIPPPT